MDDNLVMVLQDPDTAEARATFRRFMDEWLKLMPKVDYTMPTLADHLQEQLRAQLDNSLSAYIDGQRCHQGRFSSCVAEAATRAVIRRNPKGRGLDVWWVGDKQFMLRRRVSGMRTAKRAAKGWKGVMLVDFTYFPVKPIRHVTINAVITK